MKFSSKQLLIVVATLIAFLVIFEYVVNEFSIEELFSVDYSLPILLPAVVLQYITDKNRFNLITIVFYLAILFFTLVSIIHLFTIDSGFWFVEVSIPITHIIAVSLNIFMMILAISLFVKQTKKCKLTP